MTVLSLNNRIIVIWVDISKYNKRHSFAQCIIGQIQQFLTNAVNVQLQLLSATYKCRILSATFLPQNGFSFTFIYYKYTTRKRSFSFLLSFLLLFRIHPKIHPKVMKLLPQGKLELKVITDFAFFNVYLFILVGG